MKKRILILAVLVSLLLLAGASLWAAESEESEYYYKNVILTKVYKHNLGFKLLYRKSDMQYTTIYLPMEWFYGAASKGELVYGDDPDYPYCSIFWRNGEFAHIRLYLPMDQNDPSWGDLDTTKDFSAQFDVDTLTDLEF